MKNDLKKKIAKEYLLFISSIGVGLICFFSLYIFLWINTRNLTNVNNEIERRNSRSSKIFGEGWTKIQDLVEKDSVFNRWEKKWNENGLKDQFLKSGFNQPQDIIDFVNENSTKQLEERKNKTLERMRALDHGESIWKISLFTSLAYLILIFPVRYIFISIKKSLNILNE